MVRRVFRSRLAASKFRLPVWIEGADTVFTVKTFILIKLIVRAGPGGSSALHRGLSDNWSFLTNSEATFVLNRCYINKTVLKL